MPRIKLQGKGDSNEYSGRSRCQSSRSARAIDCPRAAAMNQITPDNFDGDGYALLMAAARVTRMLHNSGKALPTAISKQAAARGRRRATPHGAVLFAAGPPGNQIATEAKIRVPRIAARPAASLRGERADLFGGSRAWVDEGGVGEGRGL